MTQVTPVPANASFDGPEAAQLQGIIEVSRACSLAVCGDEDDTWAPRDLVATMCPNAYRQYLMATAGVDNQVLGYASVEFTYNDNQDLAELQVYVHPDHRRRGIGTQLLAWAEKVAFDGGRTTLVSWGANATPIGDGVPVVTTPAGEEFPADCPGCQFATRNGYSLEQVERCSVQPVPVPEDKLAAWQSDSLAHADGYRLHRWLAPVPDEWIDSLAALRSQVTGDVPLGGLAFETEIWDADRLRLRWQRQAEAGNHELIVAAEHIDSGQLVAYTQLQWNDERPDLAYQGYTFVQRPHRGHRLGMLVKSMALPELMAAHPTVRRIYTENAVENGPMLDINIALGYQLRSLDASFQKKLAIQ